MIIDALPFFNEYDILEFRLRLLWDKVDRFVIVEADHTFSGKPKPWNFSEHAYHFEWAREKIVYHKHRMKLVWDGSNPPAFTDASHPCWHAEYEQRGAIVDACAGFSDDDTLLISDCDEIPSHSVFERLPSLVRWEPVALRQHLFFYNLSCLRKEQWNGTIVTTVGTAREQGTQVLRCLRNTLPVVDEGGWHLSYFTDAAGIAEKIHSFSHREYDKPEFTDEAHIRSCMAESKDLYVRGMAAGKVGREFFPGYFLKESDKSNWWPANQH